MADITTTAAANGLPIHRIAIPGTRAPASNATRIVSARVPGIAIPGTRALTILVAFDAGARVPGIAIRWIGRPLAAAVVVMSAIPETVVVPGSRPEKPCKSACTKGVAAHRTRLVLYPADP